MTNLIFNPGVGNVSCKIFHSDQEQSTVHGPEKFPLRNKGLILVYYEIHLSTYDSLCYLFVMNIDMKHIFGFLSWLAVKKHSPFFLYSS